MLARVKQLIGNSDTATADEADAPFEDAFDALETGTVIGFSSLPQECVSGKRVTLGQRTTYRFENDMVYAYALAETASPLYFVAAESEGERYFALSRLLSEDEQDTLFGAQSLDAVMEKSSIKHLRCKENVEGFKGWTAAHYIKQIDRLAGTVTQDIVHPKSEAGQENETPLQYCLLTSPGHDYAIELEKHGDGALKVYTTAYRKSSDIAYVALPAKPRLARKPTLVKDRPWLSETGGMDTLIDMIRQGRNPVTRPQKRSAEIFAHPASPPAGFDQIVQQDALLECDVRVAVRVIEEALLNKMPIAEVVRRVLGLPVVFREKVFFSMPLSDMDYQTLATRYDLSPHDRVGIRYRIVRELSYFAGEA